MGGDSDFGRLIQQAAKLKGHQMKQERKKYEKWPAYLQHTMFREPELKPIRDSPFADRLAKANEQKSEGNDMFKADNPDDAMSAYEKALGIFRWVTNKEEDWKKKGIRDEDVSLVDYEGTNDTGTCFDILVHMCHCG